MKALTLSLLITFAPALALAQTPAPKPAAPAKPATKPATKLAPSAQKAVEEVTPIDDDPDISVSPAELEVAKRVHVGSLPCELGASVTITPLKREGLFRVQHGRDRFMMHPVESRTGAIRLEDQKKGAVWIQLGNKSMLMSQKLGLRLADECQSPAQLTVAEQLKKNPAPSLLEPLPTGPKSTSTSPTGPN